MLSTALKRIVLVSSLALATGWPGAVLGARADAGAAVVAQLYKDFAWQALVSDRALFGEGLPRQSKAVLERYFDPALVTLLVGDAECQIKVQGICNLDFDLLFASQDPRVVDLEVVQLAPGKVAVAFADPVNQKKTRLAFKLLLVGGKWKVADITYRNRAESSLKKILMKKIP
jgi:hypothetical protein